MQLSIPALLVVLFFAHSLARAEGYQFKEPFSRSGAFDANGEVTLENVNGNVEVRTWDKNEILIEGEKSAKTAEELGLIDLKIELSRSQAGITVRLPKRTGGFFSGGNIRAEVRFKLTVPASATLAKLSAVNSSVTLEGIRGGVKASSVNGSVHAKGLAGPVHLETVNGSIDARFATVGSQQKLSFETVNGRIAVSLPKDAGVQFRGSTVNGSVQCDLPLEGGALAKKSRSLSGKIGDGGASLKAQTVNGSIHLQSL